MNPVEILREKMSGENVCALITSDVNRRYFTKMKSSAGTLVVFKSAAYLIIDFRYIEKARKTAEGCEVILQRSGGGIYEQINELCKKHGVSRILIEADTVSVSYAQKLSEKLDCKIDMTCALSDMIGSIRIIKTPEQIEDIIKAQRIAEQGFEHILTYIKEGRTEHEVQLELDYFMLTHGAEALSFDTIVLSGANTSLPHGVPSDKKIQRGEFVLMDFGAVYNGWHSDMTRTVCVGEPSEKMRRVYEIVLKAQQKGLAAVRKGITGAQLDNAAREHIVSCGYGENFGHSLGHGVGMEIHEPPTASVTGETPLDVGMIVTVEPGIYLEGEFGVRIEDFVIVEENGCRNMTKAPKQLIVL